MSVYHRQKWMHVMPVTQRGLSLIELMIAMALGIFLTWGALQAFLTGKQTYSLQQAFSRVQENGRMAQEFLGYDIRGAGSYGCAAGQFIMGGTSSNLLANPTADEFNFVNSVFGADNVPATSAAGLTNTVLNPVPIANTDVLVLHTATNLGLEVLAAPAPTASQISVNNMGLKTGDILAIGNCTGVRFFKPTAISTGSPQNISYTFTAATFSVPPANMVGFSVMKVETVIYYIATNPAGNPALYRRLLADNGVSQELLDGVQDMQLEFGIDTDNNLQTDNFKTANLVTATQWNPWDDLNGKGLFDAGQQNVNAVRYSLLMRSESQVLDAPQTYSYNGATVTATDRRVRQVFTGTVGIRSRLN